MDTGYLKRKIRDITLARRIIRQLRPPAVDPRQVSIMRDYLKPDFNCIDVGAHYGDVLREMVRCAPRGQHYAFEPLPERYKHLVKDFRRVKVFPYALADKEGEATFYRTVGRIGFSGLNARGMEVEAFTVQVKRLDDLVSSPVHYIKIDVEGAEMGVFRGAERIIREHRPVLMFEHGLNAADYYGTKPEDVFDFLSGYEIFGLDAFLSRSSPLTREEFIKGFYINEVYDFVALPISWASRLAELPE